MKTFVEFGQVGGPHASFTCFTVKQGNALAHKLVHVLGNEAVHFKTCSALPRQEWKNGTHFVQCSLINGQGQTSDHLWRR